MKTTDFAMLVNQFIMEYLVAARDLSPNTVLSYRDSIVLLITFMSNVHGKRPEALEIADITAERVEEFLGWLESERTNSPSTRNIRLAAIHSLFRYLCSQRPEHIFHSQQILSIPVKKTAQTEVTYLDTAQTEKLLAAPEQQKEKGIWHCYAFFMTVDAGCRN